MQLQSASEIDTEREVGTTRRGDAEWEQVDRRLREYARHRSSLDAAEFFDLVRAEQLKIELWNVTLLCSGHHAALHAGLLTMKGEAPYHVEFRWVYGAPIPPGLDPDARRAMVKQKIHEIFDRPVLPSKDSPVDAGQPGRMPRPRWDGEESEVGRHPAVTQRGADG
jgi:hypothetical protein